MNEVRESILHGVLQEYMTHESLDQRSFLMSREARLKGSCIEVDTSCEGDVVHVEAEGVERVDGVNDEDHDQMERGEDKRQGADGRRAHAADDTYDACLYEMATCHVFRRHMTQAHTLDVGRVHGDGGGGGGGVCRDAGSV